MKINFISQCKKPIALSLIAITSFYGVRYLQNSDIPIKNSNHVSLKPFNTFVEKTTEHIDKQTLVSSQTATEINSEIKQQELGDFVEENTDRGTYEVDFKKNLVSINSNNAMLVDVLVQLSNTVDIPISTEAIDISQRVTLSIFEQPISSVLRELLAGYDYFFSYNGKKQQLYASWVYPAGTGPSIFLSSLDSINEVNKEDFYSSDPDKRVLALQQGTFDHEDARGRLIEALHDNDANVRATAILMALQNSVDLPLHNLKEMVTLDSSTLVRSAALNSLSMNSELSDATISELAESALNDPEETVREEAEAILDGLEQNTDAETSLQLPSGEELEKVS